MQREIVPLVARDTDEYNRRPMHIPFNIQICQLLEYAWQKSGRCYSCNSIRISNIRLQMHTFGMEIVQLLLKSILIHKNLLEEARKSFNVPKPISANKKLIVFIKYVF